MSVAPEESLIQVFKRLSPQHVWTIYNRILLIWNPAKRLYSPTIKKKIRNRCRLERWKNSFLTFSTLLRASCVSTRSQKEMGGLPNRLMCITAAHLSAATSRRSSSAGAVCVYVKYSLDRHFSRSPIDFHLWFYRGARHTGGRARGRMVFIIQCLLTTVTETIIKPHQLVLHREREREGNGDFRLCTYSTTSMKKLFFFKRKQLSKGVV